MGKIDIIALSKKKGYKIGMLALIGVGLVVMIIGFVLLGGVTPTVPAQRLEIDMNNLTQDTPTGYSTTISKDEHITVHTGTGESVLREPVVFRFIQDSMDIFEDIAPTYREGVAEIKLKKATAACDGGSAVLQISCGSQTALTVVITIKHANAQ